MFPVLLCSLEITVFCSNQQQLVLLTLIQFRVVSRVIVLVAVKGRWLFRWLCSLATWNLNILFPWKFVAHSPFCEVELRAQKLLIASDAVLQLTSEGPLLLLRLRLSQEILVTEKNLESYFVSPFLNRVFSGVSFHWTTSLSKAISETFLVSVFIRSKFM